jgi:hypothetical protein
MKTRMLKVGTTVRACRAEAQSAKAWSRLHGRKDFRARANGFSPRLFVSGK